MQILNAAKLPNVQKPQVEDQLIKMLSILSNPTNVYNFSKSDSKSSSIHTYELK